MARIRDIVKNAHILSVTVEVEIVRVGKTEEGKNNFKFVFSIPKQVERFVKDTNIDACAISIGMTYAMQKQESRINFIHLKEIRGLINIPLVLHGFFGLIEEKLEKSGS